MMQAVAQTFLSVKVESQIIWLGYCFNKKKNSIIKLIILIWCLYFKYSQLLRLYCENLTIHILMSASLLLNIPWGQPGDWHDSYVDSSVRY